MFSLRGGGFKLKNSIEVQKFRDGLLGRDRMLVISKNG